jgi:hypothetical protein
MLETEHLEVAAAKRNMESQYLCASEMAADIGQIVKWSCDRPPLQNYAILCEDITICGTYDGA